MRKGQTTREAIAELLYNSDVYAGLSDARKSTFRAHRKRLQENALSTEKMEEILKEYGYIVIQEKLWTH